jgi:hypothetical protein
MASLLAWFFQAWARYWYSQPRIMFNAIAQVLYCRPFKRMPPGQKTHWDGCRPSSLHLPLKLERNENRECRFYGLPLTKGNKRVKVKYEMLNFYYKSSTQGEGIQRSYMYNRLSSFKRNFTMLVLIDFPRS